MLEARVGGISLQAAPSASDTRTKFAPQQPAQNPLTFFLSSRSSELASDVDVVGIERASKFIE